MFMNLATLCPSDNVGPRSLYTHEKLNASYEHNNKPHSCQKQHFLQGIVYNVHCKAVMHCCQLVTFFVAVAYSVVCLFTIGWL